MKKIFLILTLFLSCFVLFSQDIGGDYYVATDGNDEAAGTYAAPWATWQKAFETAQAGDTVYFRGGVYQPASPSGPGSGICGISPYADPSYGYDGTSDNWICYFNYPGEVPILDGSLITPAGNYNVGIGLVRLNFTHFKGLTIRYVNQVNDNVEVIGLGTNFASNLIFENMTIHNCGGNAFRFMGIPLEYYPSITVDTIRYINCDAYTNCDSLPRTPGATLGGQADGFKIYAEPGAYVSMTGCRAWNCSDDGFDPAGSMLLEMDSCWSFNNGYLQGDGQGFKYGGNGAATDTTYVPDSTWVNVRIKNCIAASNTHRGYQTIEYGAYYRTVGRIYNNISYNNDYGYSHSNNDSKPYILCIYRNNISYSDNFIFAASYMEYTESHNTWDDVAGWPGYVITDTVTVTDADFLSVDVGLLDNARQSDGSLPDVNFMKLAETSDLIDAGTVLPLSDSAGYVISYNDVAPDIGAFEYSSGGGAGNPNVVTLSAAYTWSRAATATGNANDDGGGTISAKGICWNTSPNPTTSNSHTDHGAGTGEFTSSLTGLSANTLYYVSAYVTNDYDGGTTVYGVDYTFKTPKQSSVVNSSRKPYFHNGKPVIIR